MFFLSCPILHVLMKENGKRSLWFPGVAFRSLSIHQDENWAGRQQSLADKNSCFLSRGKSTPRNELWVLGEWEVGMDLGVELDVQGPFQHKAAHGSGRAGLCWGHLALLHWKLGEMGKNLWSGGKGRSESWRMENAVGWASSEPGVAGELPPCFCLFYIHISLRVSTHRIKVCP